MTAVAIKPLFILFISTAVEIFLQEILKTIDFDDTGIKISKKLESTGIHISAKLRLVINKIRGE